PRNPAIAFAKVLIHTPGNGGVHTGTTAESIKQPQGRQHYEDWHFSFGRSPCARGRACGLVSPGPKEIRHRRHRHRNQSRPNRASIMTEPRILPWTMGFNLNSHSEGLIYARYLLTNYPDVKIGIIYQNDDLGRDYLTGLKAGLGDKAATMLVAETSYETSDPT